MPDTTEAPKPDAGPKPEEAPLPSVKPPKQQASPLTVAAAIVGLAVILFFMADFTFGPLIPPPDPFGGMTQGEWVQKLARQTEGDFNKLSPADQKQMNSISRGNGARYLKVAYENQSKVRDAEKPKP